MDTVVAVVKGWEWICPKCNCLNEVEEIFGGYTIQKCDECDEEFEVYAS